MLSITRKVEHDIENKNDITHGVSVQCVYNDMITHGVSVQCVYNDMTTHGVSV